jgi:hypothetical protein
LPLDSSLKDTIMTRHINPDDELRDRVKDLAKREMRAETNMVRVLISEAVFARQLTARLVAAIRGERP